MRTPRRGRVRTGSTTDMHNSRARRNHSNLTGFPDVDGTLEVRPDGRLGVRLSNASGLRVTNRGLEMAPENSSSKLAGKEIADKSGGTVTEGRIDEITDLPGAIDAIATLTKRLNEVVRHLS